MVLCLGKNLDSLWVRRNVIAREQSCVGGEGVIEDLWLIVCEGNRSSNLSAAKVEGVELNFESGGYSLGDEDGSSSFVILAVAARGESAVLDGGITVD